VAKHDDSTTLELDDWRIASRRRPILSDQEKEALSQRIAAYWSAHGKTAASMIVEGHGTSSISSREEGEGGGGGATSATSSSKERASSSMTPTTMTSADDVSAAADSATMASLKSSSGSGHNFTPLPEILFGQSYLEIKHAATLGGEEGGGGGGGGAGQPTNSTIDFCLRFNTTGALISWARRHVDGAGGSPLVVITVPEASRWAAGNLAVGLKQVRYDWVFGTDYEGELLLSSEGGGGKVEGDPCDTFLDLERGSVGDGGVGWEAADSSVIDRRLLSDRAAPILFYDDITLYEDELHDHGVVSLNAKVRVMPTCWFVLLRYFLRVDGVLLRVEDTRYFHRFGQEWVGKERSRRELTFAQLGEAGLPTETSEYRDVNKVAAMLEQAGTPAVVVHSRLVLPGAPS